ncbi:SGNH hydrolase-type esterase domain-containing protein [Chytriomyces cf. hyalinus JEL632]|nr:SGNH hydrolase-type esterase domain-containing protein [Chytriomyces cf. hyalinus JEL632]
MHNLSLDQLVLFGDSITQHSFNPVIQGWGAILADAYMRRLDVVNRGFSGYNTEWCKHVLADTLASTLPAPGTSRTPQIKVMTLFLGANDAVLPEKNQRQPVPIPQYKANLLEMLATVKSLSPDTRVVIITPPPVDPLRWHEKCKLKGKEGDREVGYTKLYRDACLEVGIEAKKTWGSALQVVDIWEVFFGKGQTEYTMDDVADLLSDGLHLAARGNTLLAAALLKTIKESWPDLNPEIVKPRVTFNEQVDRTKLPDILFKNYDDY